MNVRPNQAKLKHIIKHGVQHIAASFGRHCRKHKKPQLLVLMYHRILPLNDKRSQMEEPGMTVTPESFKHHINLLKNYFSIIKLSDWIQMQHDGKKLPAMACAITFDDGWSDNFEYAYPVLKELNVPATIYLVSDMIDTTKMFWPERLARLVITIAGKYPQYWSHPELEWLQKTPGNYLFSNTAPTREELSALIASTKKYTDQEIHERLSNIEQLLKLDQEATPPSLLSWQQVTEMTDSGLIEVGSHTCNHVRLNNKIPKEVLSREIINSKKAIEEHTGHIVKTFCFPNGDICPQALTLVKQHYNGAVSTQSGWNTADSDKYQLHRIGIHQDIARDKTSFLARISGWM